MFTKILCPVDFSDQSRHATECATAIAGWFDGEVVLLHVLPPSGALATDITPSEQRPTSPAMEQAQERMAGWLHLPRGGGIRARTLIDVGSPAAAILARAQSLPADAIVIGTHGAGGFEHLVLGSVAEKVLRKSSCPVLTVPARASAGAPLSFTHVLCAIDFSDASLEAARHSFGLARKSGAAVTLLHVVEWPWGEPPEPVFGELPSAQADALEEFRRYTEKSALARLRSVANSPAAAGLTVTPRLLNGKAYASVLKAAEEEHADLIVLGVHGRNPLDLALLGSTANQVVRRASCPVLTLRA